MSIMYMYLDKRAATIATIKDYDNMLFIIQNTDKEIDARRTRMVGVGSPNMDGMPHAPNPKAGEERLVKEIDEIDVLRERYRQAVEYMNWFEPAWNELSEDEQYVLDTFYRGGSTYGSNAADMVARTYGIENTTAHKRKNRALDHLQTLLFGRV